VSTRRLLNGRGWGEPRRRCLKKQGIGKRPGRKGDRATAGGEGIEGGEKWRRRKRQAEILAIVLHNFLGGAFLEFGVGLWYSMG